MNEPSVFNGPEAHCSFVPHGHTQASSCGNLHSVCLPSVSAPPQEVTMPRDAVHPHGMVEHRDVHNM